MALVHILSFSLNRRKREQELLRMTKENHAILERITNCKPHYKVQKWDEDWQKAEEYMNSIARYPRGFCKLQYQKVNLSYCTNFRRPVVCYSQTVFVTITRLVKKKNKTYTNIKLSQG